MAIEQTMTRRAPNLDISCLSQDPRASKSAGHGTGTPNHRWSSLGRRTGLKAAKEVRVLLAATVECTF